MPKRIADLHREDIKAAIRKTGTTMAALSIKHGYDVCAVRLALYRPWPKVQAIIAAHLGRQPQEIWPTRYDAAGNPRMGHRSLDSDTNSPEAVAHRQKRVAV